MDCPLLKGKYNKQCSAVKVTVVVSARELETYCLGGNHERCPVFNTWLRRKGSIGLAEYCEINTAGCLAVGMDN